MDPLPVAAALDLRTRTAAPGVLRKEFTMPTPVRAVAYYRMSTLRQEDSIERQRSQVEPFAAHNGYTIIAEYKDEGIAGDEEEKRKDFMRMMRDAQHGGFQAILCDDKDRFGRFDSITQGYYVKPLRDAGVSLVTVAQGKIDWFSFGGRITAAALDEAKKIESQATSRRVISWMLEAARKGRWLGGPPPYGYRVRYRVEFENGKTVRRPECLEPGDPTEVRAVQLMFRLYGEKGFTLDQIAQELYERGIPAYKGRQCWQKTTIRAILRNRKYVGDMTWNAGHDGKYSEVVNGTVNTSDARIKPRRNSTSQWVIVPDTHEPLVSRELFEKVQAKLEENKTHTSPGPKGGPFLLSGLLVCGSCGWRMIGHIQMKDKRYYKCGKYHQEGVRGCWSHYIRESKLLACIKRKVQEVLLNPKRLAALRAEVEKRYDRFTEGGTSSTYTRSRRQIADLNAKIDKGIENMAAVPADMVNDFAAMIREWKEERSRLEQALERQNGRTEEKNPAEVMRRVEEELSQFRDAMMEEDGHAMRALLRELISKVELHFDHKPCKGKTRSIFRRGIIYIRPQKQGEELFADLLCAANPIRDGSSAKR
jgi:DNA invertase Pin-like site-specific DNA recombinase